MERAASSARLSQRPDRPFSATGGRACTCASRHLTASTRHLTAWLLVLDRQSELTAVAVQVQHYVGHRGLGVQDALQGRLLLLAAMHLDRADSGQTNTLIKMHTPETAAGPIQPGWLFEPLSRCVSRRVKITLQGIRPWDHLMS